MRRRSIVREWMEVMTETSGLLARRSLLGYSVSPVSIGCAPLGNMRDTFGYGVSDDDAYATIRAALAGSFNYLDTAAAYGNGESERRIGHVLKAMGGLPEDAFLQTKVGSAPPGADGTRRYDGETIRRRFERSLELLGVDRVELVFLHDPEHAADEEIFGPGGAMEALQALKDAGVIGHIGLAGGPIEMELRYLKTGLFEAVITHNRYTLLNRIAEPLLDLAREMGIPLLNAAPYGSGMLAKGPSNYPRYAYAQAPESMVARTRELETICARHGIPLGAAALQFSLRDRRITNTIVGMSKPERLVQTLAWAETTIPDEAWEDLLAVPFDMTEPQ
jgi:D-threo-aldose 1-dehydrogenase